jgi:hypothetical protein
MRKFVALALAGCIGLGAVAASLPASAGVVVGVPLPGVVVAPPLVTPWPSYYGGPRFVYPGYARFGYGGPFGYGYRYGFRYGGHPGYPGPAGFGAHGGYAHGRGWR